MSPRVSVIIPVYHSEATLPACLDALRRQTFRDFETIVVDSGPGTRGAQLARRLDAGILVFESPHRLLPHAARNQGVALSRGAILVHTDPDCVADPDWLGHLVRAQDAGHPVAGGAIAPERGWWQTAIHMAKFAWQLPGGQPGPRPDLATANVSYSRAVWDQLGPFLETRFAGDSDFIWRVRAAGIEPWFEPRALVRHRHEATFRRFLKERFARGADFGAMRIERQHWAPSRIAAYLLAAPLLPAAVFLYATRYSWRSGYLGTWLWTWPFQALASVAWCAGEARSHWRALRGYFGSNTPSPAIHS